VVAVHGLYVWYLLINSIPLDFLRISYNAMVSQKSPFTPTIFPHSNKEMFPVALHNKVFYELRYYFLSLPLCRRDEINYAPSMPSVKADMYMQNMFQEYSIDTDSYKYVLSVSIEYEYPNSISISISISRGRIDPGPALWGV